MAEFFLFDKRSVDLSFSCKDKTGNIAWGPYRTEESHFDYIDKLGAVHSSRLDNEKTTHQIDGDDLDVYDNNETQETHRFDGDVLDVYDNKEGLLFITTTIGVFTYDLGGYKEIKFKGKRLKTFLQCSNNRIVIELGSSIVVIDEKKARQVGSIDFDEPFRAQYNSKVDMFVFFLSKRYEFHLCRYNEETHLFDVIIQFPERIGNMATIVFDENYPLIFYRVKSEPVILEYNEEGFTKIAKDHH